MKIFNLTHLGLLRIQGEGAKKFLQGQLTCNLDDVTSGQSRKGAHCNPQGRIISLFHLFLYQDDYYLQMPRELVPIALRALQKYAVFFKVALTDASGELSQTGYLGEAISGFPDTPYEQLVSSESVIIRLPDQEARYQSIGQSPWQTTQTTALTEWIQRDFIEGIAAIYPETSGKFLPHELNLPILGAVSFTKGCYTGQEIIARMHYRGKLKNRLYSASVQTDLPPTRGHDIYHQGKSKGSVVDYCQLIDNNYQLLMIADENDVSKGQLTLDAEEKYRLLFYVLHRGIP